MTICWLVSEVDVCKIKWILFILSGVSVMNKISRAGIMINILTYITVIILVLLSQKMPDSLMYVFCGGLILTLAGAIVNKRKNQLQ